MRNKLWGGFSTLFFIPLTVFILTGCGGDDPSATKISGVIQLGLVNGATVTVYKVNEDGSVGASIASTTSGSDGAYSFTEAQIGSYDGPAVIEATGGSYTNEADGSTVAIASTEKYRTILEGLSASELASYNGQFPITPLSNIMTERTLESHQPGFTWAAAVLAAKTEVEDAYGVSPFVMPYSPNTSVPNVSDDRAKVMTLIAGMSEAAASAGVTPGVYYKALQQDFLDGDCDGAYGGTTVTYASNSSAMSTTPLTQINTGMNNWDRLPPGISSVSTLPVIAITSAFTAAPENKFDDIKGYFAERNLYDPKYSKYLDPDRAEYTPTIDSHNGAAYDATKDFCNPSGANDSSRCPTHASFNNSSFISWRDTQSMGTYDPKTAIYTNPAGTVYTPAPGGQYINPAGAPVPPPNTSITGTAYTGSYTPGTACAMGTYYNYTTGQCVSGGSTCTPPAWYDPVTLGCKTAHRQLGLKERIYLASMQFLNFFSKLIAWK